MAVDCVYGNFNLGSFDEIFPELMDTSSPKPEINVLMPETSAETSHGRSNRFKAMNETSLQKLVEDTKSKATSKSTSWGVRLFKQWLLERNYSTDFEDLSTDELNTKLRLFYGEVRTIEGKTYSKSSFVGLRAAIHRYIQAPPFERNINILNDREFHSANNVFISVLRKLKQEGLDQAQHHEPMTEADIIKLRHYLRSVTPSNLLNKVWFDLTLGLALRGNENQRCFTKDTFKVKIDEAGVEYLQQEQTFLTKNHRGDASDTVESKRRIYATGGESCPVNTYKLYISKINPNCLSLFQYPKKNISASDTTWFTAKPLGENALKSMMKNLSKLANLNNMYTNHCVRSTAINLLSYAVVEGREICKLTGHRNAQSLNSYNYDSSVKQKHNYSNILQGHIRSTHSQSQSHAYLPIQSTCSSNTTLSSISSNNFYSQSMANGMFTISNSSVVVNNYFK